MFRLHKYALWPSQSLILAECPLFFNRHICFACLYKKGIFDIISMPSSFIKEACDSM